MPANKSIAKVEEKVPVVLTSRGIPSIPYEGMEEVEITELPLPIVKFVGPNSKNVDLADGTTAKPGSYFDNSTKEAYSPLNFRVLAVGHVDLPDLNEEDKFVPAYAIVGYNEDSKEVFYTAFRSTNYYESRSNLIPMLVKAGKLTGHIFDVVVSASSQDASATVEKNGRSKVFEYLKVAFTFDPTKVTKGDETEKLLELQAKWKTRVKVSEGARDVDRVVKAEEKGQASTKEAEEVSKMMDENVSSEEIPF